MPILIQVLLHGEVIQTSIRLHWILSQSLSKSYEMFTSQNETGVRYSGCADRLTFTCFCCLPLDCVFPEHQKGDVFVGKDGTFKCSAISRLLFLSDSYTGSRWRGFAFFSRLAMDEKWNSDQLYQRKSLGQTSIFGKSQLHALHIFSQLMIDEAAGCA